MGVYVFEPRVLKYIPKGQYLDFPDLVKILIAAGEKVIGYEFSGYWQDPAARMITNRRRAISRTCARNSCRRRSPHELAHSPGRY